MIENLKKLSPFSELDEVELKALTAAAKIVEYRDGAVIIREGRDDDRFIILIEGSAKVSRMNEKGKEIILAQFSPGAYIGEISLLTGAKRTADVSATARCVTIELVRAAFEKHINTYPGLVRVMLSEMAKRLHSSSDKIVDNSFLSVEERLLKLLFALSTPVELDDAECRIVRECPPHQELAAMIGANREVITRALKQLEKSNVIERRDKTIILLSDAYL